MARRTTTYAIRLVERAAHRLTSVRYAPKFTEASGQDVPEVG
jgi:hypothetical protein